MKAYRALAVSLAAFAASSAMAASAPTTEATRLTSQYAEWAGGKSNADALVAGLRNGAPVTLVTNGAGRSVSIAGFTPSASMSYGNVGAALASAQHSLARLGIASWLPVTSRTPSPAGLSSARRRARSASAGPDN